MKRRTLLIGIGASALLTLQAGQPALAQKDRAAADAAVARRQPEADVRRGEGDGYPLFNVSARIVANVSLQRAWQVSTDYDRLAEFVPDLTASHLVSRNGRECIVAQEGFEQFLFIKQRIHLLVRVEEIPLSAIAVTLIEGNMHVYRADWTLRAIDADTTQIDYNATIAPMFYVPSLFGAAVMKSDLRNMLSAVVREMEKPAK